jgi:hypothetical protein
MIELAPQTDVSANRNALLAGDIRALRAVQYGATNPQEPHGRVRWSMPRLNAFAARVIDAHYSRLQAAPARQSIHASAANGELVNPARAGAVDSDPRRIADHFSIGDRCELFFHFSAERRLDAGLIHSNDTSAAAATLSVTRSLQFALGNLGFPILLFRNLARNVSPAAEYLQRSARCRRPPILTWGQLDDLITHAGSAPFLFSLYAVVPIHDLIALDLEKPATFDRAWVASVDPSSGNWYAVEANGPVTVCRKDGWFTSGSEFCRSLADGDSARSAHYHASVRNQVAAT